ncbi:hypothetical protein ABMA28_012663 [Loxostege sticticalis]|uniref:EB domain-containing protein n=1 Tax=Loxostege sticticalis TaxID=481309 RepID=A0ABD0S4K9_LOXSC
MAVGDKVFLVLGCILHAHSALALWQCSLDADCTSMAGSVCVSGECICPPGKQSVMGGTACVDPAPYHFSTCFEDFQCSRLFTSFECRRSGNSTQGNCLCRPGSHYFRGRCWVSITLGGACTRDEECQGGLNDPFSMSCTGGTCQCADGYYFRQRGECRRKALAVGDHCVLDQDCFFDGGACGRNTLRCYDRNAPRNIEVVKLVPLSEDTKFAPKAESTLSQYGELCDASRRCIESLECSRYGVCVCPLGYYPNADNSLCLAELGSPVTSQEQCTGVFTEIRDGVCTCQNNFFFNENMRTCVKPARMITDACTMDANCHTFGASSRCGAPQQWGLRSCECILEDAVWDASRSMCRLFAGVGEICEEDSDCLAGDLEINCVREEDGQAFCRCPPGFLAQDGLCLTLGLELGAPCQVSAECTGTSNAVCEAGQCSCDTGYQQVADFCAPSIGGSCDIDSDCVIENTICGVNGTCQCNSTFAEFAGLCWLESSGFGAACNVSAQCVGALPDSSCIDNVCQCGPTLHFRDNGCWPRTRLFEACSRSSQCYLEDDSERALCRNSLCQCSFDHPFSEELGTCRSSASSILANTIVMVAALIYLFCR